MLMIWLLRLAAFVAMVSGVVGLIYSFSPDAAAKRFRRPGAVVAVAGFLFLAFFMSAEHVPGNHVAVVENTASGGYSTLSPGIHFWPLEPHLVPFSTKVTKYNLRQTRIEIGKPGGEDEEARPTVSAESDSPGKPPVYFWLTGWAAPNDDPEAIIELHKRYGTDWADSWVETNLQDSVKEVQGGYPLEYVGGNREDFSIEVQESLQSELTVGETQLVRVDQIAVRNFDYNDATNQRLEELAAVENQRRVAEGQQAIAEANAVTQQTEAETRRQVAATDAQTEIERARGEAEAIRITNEAISSQGAAYLQLKWIEKWDGKLPLYSLGDGGSFIFDLGSLPGTATPPG